MKRLILILMCILLVGCGMIVSRSNRSKLVNLNVGMSKPEVQSVMGGPKRTESYPQNGDVSEYWFYMTGNCPGSRCHTPLKFVNGKLVGWGLAYYDEIKEFKKNPK